MIGNIAFSKDGISHVATLGDDRSWSVTPPLDESRIGRVLDLIVSLYGGPADGAFGPDQIAQAGMYLTGTGYEVTATSLEPKKPMPPGTIY